MTTFLAFMLPDSGKAQDVNEVLKENGAGAVYFAENTWHYYPKWEHLLNSSTLAACGWPFTDQDARRRVVYDQEALPASAKIIDRTLVYQVPVKLTEERLVQISSALEKAAGVLR